jgi:hydrogenase maturation protease
MNPSVLVLGYGNELRGDDAVGPCIARAVASWQQPGVRALAVPQLTPDLADLLGSVERVIFVDACAEAGLCVRVHSLQPADAHARLGHTSDPRWLLALTELLHGEAPAAWLVTVPARDFTLGAPLSLTTAEGMTSALQQIARLLHGGHLEAD